MSYSYRPDGPLIGRHDGSIWSTRRGTSVSLPEITHLQFSVLAFLRSDEQPGKAVREQLAGLGLKRSGPAFYQLMARLEDAELVGGRYDQKIVEGQIIKERLYTITGQGLEAWETTRDFYVEAIRSAGQTVNIEKA